MRMRTAKQTAPEPNWTEDTDGMFSLNLDTKKNRAGGCALLVFSIFWNSITWTILVMSIRDGEGGLGLYLFMIPFILIGLATAVGALALIIGRKGLGIRMIPPKVRVSRQPLRLGEEFRVEVAQMAKKPMQMTGMTVELRGQEWVTYRRGTTTYHDTHELFSSKVELLPAQSVQPGRPFGDVCSFSIRAEAMHSFLGTNNRVEWVLKVHTGVKGWVDHKTDFPLHVCPRMVQGS
jgi:hypothetical protein